MDSISTKIQELKTAWQQLYASLGIEKIIKGVLDTVTKIIKQLSNYDIGRIFVSLIQNFVVLKKTLKLIFNTGESGIKKITTKYNELRKLIEEPIKITLDTSQAEQQLRNLNQKVQSAANGTLSANSSSTTAQSGGNTELYSIAKKLFRTNQFNQRQGEYRQVLNGTMSYDTNNPYFEGISSEEYGQYQTWARDNVKDGQGVRSVYKNLQSLGQSSENLATDLQKTTSTLSAFAFAAQIAGTGLQALSLTAETKSTDNIEKGKILSGFGSLLSSAGTGASIGVKIGAAVGNPLLGAGLGALGGLLFSGISGAFSTISDGLYVDYEERLKALQEEATELTATQTEKKGEETSLKNSIQTYKELAAAQYDSAEAAEEYQEHMNSMAEQYPELVDHYDSAGNAIIDVQKAEEALAKARYETSQATVDVLQNELKQREIERVSLQELYDDEIQWTRNAEYSQNVRLQGIEGVSFDGNSYDISELYENQSDFFKQVVEQVFTTNLKRAHIGSLSGKDLTTLNNALTNAFINNNKEIPEGALLLAADAGLFLNGGFGEKKEYSLSNITEKDFSLAPYIQQAAKDLIEVQAESIGFKYDGNLDDYSIPDLYKLWVSFISSLKGQLDQANESLENAANIITGSKIKSKLDQMAVNDTDLFNVVDSYGTLMSQIGTKIVETSLGNINIAEASLEDSKNYNTFLDKISESANFLAGLTEDKLETVAEIWDNFGYYGTSKDLSAALEESGIELNEEITNAIVSLYKERTSEAKERAQKAIDNASSLGSNKIYYMQAFNDNEDDLGIEYIDKMISIINLIDDYTEEGLTIRAQSLNDAAKDLILSIKKLKALEQEALFPIIDEIEWSDADSLDKAIESISDINDEGRYDAAIASLKQARENMAFNIETEINLATEAYKSAAEGAKTIQSNASSGMDWDEAFESFDKVKTLDAYEDLTWDDFVEYDATLGKFIYTNKGLAAATEKQKDSLDKETENLKKAIENLDALEGVDLTDITTASDISNYFGNLNNAQKDQLQQWVIQWEESGATESFSNYVKNLIETEKLAADTAIQAIEAYTEQYNAIIDSNNQRLNNLNNIRGKLSKKLEYASKTSLTEEDITNYANFFTEDADQFFDEIFIKGAIDRWDESTQSYDIIDFDAYWDVLNTGLSQDTDAYLEARANWASNRISQEEKKAEAITGEIDKIFGGKAGDLIDLTYLENLGVNLKNIGFKYLDGIYQIGDIDYQALIEEIRVKGVDDLGNSLTSVEDKIVSLFNDWAELLDNGLSGKLSFENAEVLKNQFGLSELDFTQTAEGLKISSNAAYSLVAQISKIDSNAGQIATEKMAANLSKANEEYDDIYSVMRKIEKIEEEIAKKPDNARLELLQAELVVAKEIEQTLKEADDTFNFMSRDLPSGFDDPMSAWEGVGDAMQVLNGDDFATGKMDFTDFYNMIDFMGDEFVATAFGFEKDAFTAADLIEAGASAISMVDGEAFVDLSKLGANFNISADGMKEGITEGIHKVAESQIEMLDAAIGILETVVAMGNITKIDENNNGLLDLSEVFSFNEGEENPQAFTEGYINYLDELKKALEEAGVDLSEIIIGGKSLNELLTSNFEEWKQLDFTWDEYLEIINALVIASQSQDFDSNDIKGIFENLKLDKDITFTSGEKTYTFKSDGTHFEWTEGETTGIYNAPDETTHPIDMTGDVDSQIAEINDEIAFNNAVGDHIVVNGGVKTLELDNGVEIKYVLTNGGLTAYYEGKEYVADKQLGSVQAQIKADIANNLKLGAAFSESGYSKTENTVEVGEKIYTEVQLSTGGTKWVSEDGKEIISQEGMETLLTQKLASLTGGEMVSIPLEEAGIEIASVKEISFTENAIPEEGVPFEGSIRITPTAVDVEATDYQIDFLDKNGQVSKTISISGEAQLAAVISGAKIEGDKWILPDMSAGLNLEISEETQERIKAFFDELIQKFQNIPVSFITSGDTTTTTTNSKNKTSAVTTTPSINYSSITEPIAQIVSNIQSYIDKLKTADDNLAKETKAITNLNNVATALKNVPATGASRITAVSNAINKIPSSKTISITLKVNVSNSNVKITSTSSGKISGGGNGIDANVVASKGNVALSKGTLMGELGPELVVSNGHYFTVGENGAEFVDLADDAIVFNHLQTKKLLGSGSTGRGTPVTNEKKATSFATGNAKADAATTLAELKQIRAMWKALLNASASELGAKAGSGSSGGGSDKDSGAVEYDLERWYNLLRQIAKLEQQITYEQQKRENMQSGYKYVNSLEKELRLLEKQLGIEKELASLQYDYYLKRMEDINKSVYSKIFTYDSEGLMQYTSGENRGLDALAKLQATDENGVLKMSAAEQLSYITNVLGISANDLKYKSDGTEAEEDKDKVQVFFDNVDSIMDELDELYDSYHEHAEKIEDLTSAQNEILQEYIDNQRSLEDKLVQAIEDREQAIIDQLTDEREALEKSSQSYIEGLSEALTKEQNLYSKNQTDAETAKLQRRLAILQRSGGSASEIKSLQDQIDSRLQDAYFQAQQDQIEAIQEASNNQLEKLQTQIDLLTETLEYQKENGLLWQEVYEMMNQWTPEQILQFIEQYTKSYKENSSLENAESSKETLKEAEIWAAQRDSEERDKQFDEYYQNASYDTSLKESYKEAARTAYDEAYLSGGREAAEAAANQVFETAKKNQSVIGSNAPADGTATSSSSSSDLDEAAGDWYGKVQTNTGKGLYIRKAANLNAEILGKIPNGEKVKVYGVYDDGKWLRVKYNGIKGYAYKDYIKKYADGGLVDYTGPAWVDGTKSKPEAFLSAEDTALLKSTIFNSGNNPLTTLVSAIKEITHGSRNYSTVNNDGITIENVSVNIQPGTISNDYDARRAGEMALEEMVKIARKTTNRVVSR